MTCFWDGLLKKLKPNDFIKSLNVKHKPNCDEFVMLIKSNNIKTPNVKCNDKTLTDQEIDDNIIRIKNIKNINKGYLCSSCDPVLILVSQLFSINIIHNFNGTEIKYINPHAKGQIYIRSDSDHLF